MPERKFISQKPEPIEKAESDQPVPMSTRQYLNIALLIAVAFLAGGMVTGKGCELPNWPVDPKPVYPASVQAIADGMKGYPVQAAQLGGFYADFSKTVAGSTSGITVGNFATAHRSNLQDFVTKSNYSCPAKVGDKIDAALAEVIGLNQDDLISPKKSELVKRIDEIAAALKGVK